METSLAWLLDPAVKHERVLRTVRGTWERQQVSEATLCLGLRRLFRDNVHRRRGRTRFDDWAETNLGIPRKLAGLFSWMGELLERLPKTLAALESGELGYSKVREFVKLATPETEDHWIEYAKTHTNREIETKVDRKKAGNGTQTTKVVSRVTGQDRQAARKARRVLEKRAGKKIRRQELFGEMAKAIAEGTDGVPTAPTDAKADGKTGKPPVYVSIQPCPICLETFTPTPEGLLRTPMRDWVQAVKDRADVFDLTDQFFCECGGERHRRDRCSNWSPIDTPKTTSRYVRKEWLETIRARDGWVCRVPGCGCDGPMHTAHLRGTHADGTPATPETAGQNCSGCNDLTREDRITILGIPPYERYYDAEGNFLGYGYDRRPRDMAGDGGSSVSHVGNGAEAPEGTEATRPRADSDPPEAPEGGSEAA